MIINTNSVMRAYILLLLSTIPSGLIVSIYLNDISLFWHGLAVIGPPVIISSIILLYIKDKNKKVNPLSIRANILVKSFLIVYALTLISLATTSYRSWHYFIGISIMYGILITSIFSGSSIKNTIFLLMLLLVNLSWGVGLNYQMYFSGGDIFLHRLWSELTYAMGNTVPPNMTEYADFPLYHIYVALTMAILNLPVDPSLILLMGGIFATTPLVIYLIATRVLEDTYIISCTVVLYTLYPSVMFYNQYIVTRVVAFVGFLYVIYIMFYKGSFSELQYTSMIIIFLPFLILVHHVSTLQILAVIGIYSSVSIVVQRLNNDSIYQSFKNSMIDMRVIFAILLGMISYWLFSALRLFTYRLIPLLTLDTTSDIPKYDVPSHEFHHFTQYVHLYLIFVLSLVGIGYIISKKKRNAELFTMAIFCLFMSVLYIPNPIHTIDFVSELRFDRFRLLLSPFIAIILSVGLISIYNLVSYKISPNNMGAKYKGAIVVVVLVILLSFSSVTATTPQPVAQDSKDVSWEQNPEGYFGERDIQAISFIHTNAKSGSIVTGDYEVARYYRGFSTDLPIYDELGYTHLYRNHLIPHIEQENKGYTIIREYKFSNDGLKVGESGNRYMFDDKESLIQPLEKNHGKIYTSEYIHIYDDT